MSLTKVTYSMISGAPVSVLDNGADPTGFADSSSAFTTAATAAGTQSVFVPKGTYKLTGTITGNFYSFGGVTISSGTITINDVTGYQFASGPRDAICYTNATSVSVFRNYATMGGFRFRGQYTKGRAPTFPMPSSKVASIAPSGLGGGLTTATLENWYGIFACANAGDTTATIKTMPFLRAGVVAGSVVPLSRAGEAVYITSSQTYAWPVNSLAGVDCLVISENSGWSGRVTPITANTTTSVTLTTIGSVTEGDFLLPAPSGFTEYVYLGSFYLDTAEVRNIYDAGDLVKAKMVYLVYPNDPTGSIPTPTMHTCRGYISPLATAIVLDSSCVLSTASTGDYTEYFAGDGSGHTVQSPLVYKDNSTNMGVVFDNVQVPFLYHQSLYFRNAGALTATRINGQLNVTGWIEP